MMPADHIPSVDVHGQVRCSCGWEHTNGDTWTNMSDAARIFAEHFALEMQALKPRARRGGVDDSEPTSASHQLTRRVLALYGRTWASAHAVWAAQAEVGSKRYSPQRIRTCLAGLVRAGLVEERKPGRVRQYRLKNSSANAGE